MPHLPRLLFATLCLFGATLLGQAHAQSVGTSNAAQATGPDDKPVITTQLIGSHSAVQPGQTISLAWQFKLSPKWHIYYSNPGDSGLPPELKSPQGQPLTLTFPVPHTISIPPVTNYGYTDAVTFTTTYTVPATQTAGTFTPTFNASFLYCNDVCMPGTATLQLPLTVAGAAIANPAYNPQQHLPQPGPQNLTAQINGNTATIILPADLAEPGIHFIPSQEGTINDSATQTLSGNMLKIELDDQAEAQPASLNGLLVLDGDAYTINLPLHPGGIHSNNTTPPADTSLMGAIFFALLAGLILNLMPCVLPVLSLKLLSLVRNHHGPARTRHTLTYTAGILISFWAFAILIWALQKGGAQIGWGFHLQNPLFVAGLALLLLTVALNFFGVFEVGHTLTRLAAAPDRHKPSLPATFLTGVLAVVVATPCTVPFMGSAMAYALTQPFLSSFAVFTALGLGLALPFLLAVPFPHIFQWLPKPGPWISTFRHALGWPMLATALWLAYIFATQTMANGSLALFGLFTAALCLSLALWLHGRRGSPITAVAVVIIAVVGLIGLQRLAAAPPPTSWQKFNQSEIVRLSAKQPVFVDFTADWCLTCKVTEATVLNTSRTQALFKSHNTALFRADWTLQSPEITAELARHNRKGVPLYLLYRPGQPQPVILPQILTYATLQSALTKP